MVYAVEGTRREHVGFLSSKGKLHKMEELDRHDVSQDRLTTTKGLGPCWGHPK